MNDERTPEEIAWQTIEKEIQKKNKRQAVAVGIAVVITLLVIILF